MIRRSANDRIEPEARTCLAGIQLRAQAVVVTRRPIGLVRVVAYAGERVARADRVALIESNTSDGVCPRASTVLAAIHLRASVAIVAHGAIGSIGIAAHARRGIAGTGNVALIERCANDRGSCGASAGLAGIRRRTRITIGARRSIGQLNVGGTRTGTARACFGRIARRAVSSATNRAHRLELTTG